MTSSRLGLVLLSAILAACTSRSDGSDDASMGTDGGPDTEGSEGDGDGSGSQSGSASGDGDGSGSQSGSASADGDDGSDPDLGCAGDAPTCFEQETGTCSHVGNEAPAECVDATWACPEGFVFEHELECEPESFCDDPPPTCWIGGDCAAETYEATCPVAVWECEDGDSQQCAWLCEPGDVPPDECWDQGPGECSDATVPPSCTDGAWQCPIGFDFGGFGEGCEWPG